MPVPMAEGAAEASSGSGGPAPSPPPPAAEPAEAAVRDPAGAELGPGSRVDLLRARLKELHASKGEWIPDLPRCRQSIGRTSIRSGLRYVKKNYLIMYNLRINFRRIREWVV